MPTMRPAFLPLLALFTGLLSMSVCKNPPSRPVVVNIGAVFSFNSIIGGVAKVAIEAAVDDINSDPIILRGSKLVVTERDTNCSGFLGIIEALQLMETDIVAIVGPQCSTIAHVISYLANEHQVPLLSFGATDPTLSSLQFPFFVRTTQSDLFQMSTIAAVINYYQWREAIAIYADDDYGRNGIASLDDKLTERNCKIYKAPFAPDASSNDIQNLLVNIALMESRIIVLHANPDNMLTIFSLASQLQMLGNGYVWIATDLLSSYIDSLAPLPPETMDTFQGVLTLRQHTANSEKKSTLRSKWGVLTQKYYSCNLRLNSYGLYAYDTMWTVAWAIDAFFNDGGKISFSNDPKLHNEKGGALHLEATNVFDGGNLLLDKVRKTNFTGVTGQVQFAPDGNLIHPAYDIINVIGTGLRTVGYWSNYSGLSVVPPEVLYSKPLNSSSPDQRLHDVIWPGETIEKPRGWVFPYGRALEVVVPYRVGYREFVMKDKATETVEGYCIDVFTAAAALLPYQVSYKFRLFGNGRDNPNYGELVNLVASNVYDAAIGDISIVSNRTRTVDFTQPFIQSGLVVLAPVKKHNPNVGAFLQPFTLQMWCVTGLAFLIVAAVVWVFEHGINTGFSGPLHRQVVSSIWFSFSTLFLTQKQGIKRTAGRAAVITWFFVVHIIQSSYTASLTSILTVQQLSSPIKGIDSLRSSNEPIGFQTGSFAENYMVEELRISRSRLIALGSPNEYARALELGPRNGGVAAVVDELPYIELFLATECNFEIVGSEFTRSGWGFAFPRDSPLAADFSTAILTLSENGDLQRIHDKWLTSSACSSDTNKIESNQLHLSCFGALFLMCVMTSSLALAIHFFVMFRQFVRQVPPDRRSLMSFLSFVFGMEEDVKSRSNCTCDDIVDLGS